MCQTTRPVSSCPYCLPPTWLRASPESVGSLNRLRTGVGCLGASLYCWGMLDTPKCICGAKEQTAIHIIFDCAILRPPNCLEDLQSPDINNTKWFEYLVDFVRTAAHTQEEVGRSCNCVVMSDLLVTQ